VSQPPRIGREQPRLDAAVLVAELDLEVDDALADAVEPERAGLDHAGVDRPDRDRVDLLAGDVVVGVGGHRDRRAPGVAHRLEPRVVRDPDAVLLVELALEDVELREVAGERVVAVRRGDDGARGGERAAGVLEHGGDDDVVARRGRGRVGGGDGAAVERDRARAAAQRRRDVIAPRPRRQRRDRRHGLAVDEHGRGHPPSSVVATERIRSLIGAGT
jgi:hypothetical protein